MPTLTPVDRTQCQAEKPNPDWGPLRLGGSTKKLIRCTNAPVTIATETAPGSDGLKGKMSLCADCEAVSKLQLPFGFCTYRPLRKINPAKLDQVRIR